MLLTEAGCERTSAAACLRAAAAGKLQTRGLYVAFPTGEGKKRQGVPETRHPKGQRRAKCGVKVAGAAARSLMITAVVSCRGPIIITTRTARTMKPLGVLITLWYGEYRSWAMPVAARNTVPAHYPARYLRPGVTSLYAQSTNVALAPLWHRQGPQV